jgi:hypothetical protein
MLGRLLSLMGVVVVAGAGCLVRIAPPPTPDKVMPKVTMDPEPPGDGDGQVIVDTTNGPATVTVVLLAMGGSTALTKTVCATTPCAVNLPIGSHDLIFAGKADPSMASTDAVQVARAPSILRHTVGKVDASPGLLWGGFGLVTVGGCGMLVYGIFASSSAIPGESKTGDYIGLGVSTAITAAGAWMMYAGRTRLQPGSSVQWTPDGAIPVDKKSGRTVMYTGNGVRVTW